MMQQSFKPFSLILIGTILFNITIAFDPSQGHRGLRHWRLAARDRSSPTSIIDTTGPTIVPCSGAGCTPVYPDGNNLPCADVNGTTITAGKQNQQWTMLCNIDFFAQDIYPFILAGSFEECLDHCDKYNENTNDLKCAGFVFAPDRLHSDNDCYLKSSVNNPVSPSTIHLIGATILPKASVDTSSPSTASQFAATDGNQPDDDREFKLPHNLKAKLLGTSTNTPSKHFVSHVPALPIKLASKLLQPGINLDLVTNYPLAQDTGSWTESNAPPGLKIGDLTVTPRLSRDGGKGGSINGTHIFYFCDTATFGEVEGPLGYMNGFVSSSAAIDVTHRALKDDSLELQDPIGQWQDDVGRLRGWIPLTTGEEAFNIAVSGDGFRYAVWPESSFITLNQSHSLIYAPIVYVEVDMKTQHAEFTSLGNTLVTVSIDPTYGPHADRIVKQMFGEDEVEWGSVGGFRAWTKTGQGTNDGMVYLFGQVEGGVLVAKVPATNVTDRSSYTYWNGKQWSSTMQGKNSTAYVIKQPVMDADIFYVPACKCFLMVYLTPFADNTFYIRKLLPKTKEILLPYVSGGTDDYAEALVQGVWSNPTVLYKPQVPAEGYIYAGGCHLGYFGDKDITNGGWKLLITWTEHTPKDPNNPASGYAHKSVVLS